MTPRAYMPESKTSEHGTPRDLFAALDAAFGFTVDAASTSDLAKCERFISPEQNALGPLPWGGPDDVIWLNPPYGDRGKLTDAFVRRGVIEAGRVRQVVCLLPAHTSTRWWHEAVMAHACEVRLIRGRLTFEGSTDSATSGHAIVRFFGDFRPTFHGCDKLGRILTPESQPARLLEVA